MKVVGFTPWEYSKTSIRANSNNSSSLLCRLIGTSNTSSLSSSSYQKRNKVSLSNTSSSNVRDTIPYLVLTGHHQLCILGHSSINNSKQPTQGVTGTVQQIPNWIYSSRPTVQSSFLPSSSSSSVAAATLKGSSDSTIPSSVESIPALVEPVTRTVFVTQNHNSTLKLWNIDSNITGPDDDPKNTLNDENYDSAIQKIQFPSPIICMETFSTKLHSKAAQKKAQQSKKQKRNQKPPTPNKGTTQDHHDSPMDDTHTTPLDHIQGGITGLLSNGQMFIVLLTASGGTKLGIFGDAIGNTLERQNESATQRKSSRRSINKGAMNGSSDNDHTALHDHEKILFTTVSFTPPSGGCHQPTVQESIGQKRKLSFTHNDHLEDSGGLGDITLTVLSLNPKNGTENISYTQHSLSITNLSDQLDTPLSVHGNYSRKSNPTSIPANKSMQRENAIPSNDHQHFRVSQLDQHHVAFVFKDTLDFWHCALFDIRLGVFITKPFRLPTFSSSLSKPCDIVGIGGFSNLIIAILTSNDILTLYDIRRAIILQQVRIRDVFDSNNLRIKTDEENEDDFSVQSIGLVTHRNSGTIILICNETINPNKKNCDSFLSIVGARVGVLDDSYDETSKNTISKNRRSLTKGSCNFSTILSSTMNTLGVVKDSATPHLGLFPQTFDMKDWYFGSEHQDAKVEKGNQSIEDTVNLLLHQLESYRNDQMISDRMLDSSLISIFIDSQQLLNRNHSSETTNTGKDSASTTNGFHHKSTSANKSIKTVYTVPQRVIDAFASTAIDLIITPGNSTEKVLDGIQVLNKCIESGQISARNHFIQPACDRRVRGYDVFPAILLSLKRLVGSSSRTAPANGKSLYFISNVLRKCKDTMSEHILVCMIHHILCHVSTEEMSSYWMSGIPDAEGSKTWHLDSEIKVLEKRYKLATKQLSESKGNTDELKTLITTLENRLFLSRQIFFVGKIVSHSKCNSAILRSSLHQGLTQNHNGEITVFIQILAKLLRKSGRDKNPSSSLSNGNFTRTSCIVQWISAVVDANIWYLRRSSSDEDDAIKLPLSRVQKSVAAAIAQAQAVVGISDVLDSVDDFLNKFKTKSAKSSIKTNYETNLENGSVMESSMVSIPAYGIERLVF